MSRRGGRKTVVLAASVLFFLAGCKSKSPLLILPVEAKSKEALVEEMKESEYDFTTLSAKASVDIYNGDKRSTIRASLRMRKDSAIWINFSYIGFAGARVLITRDSVKMINYRESKYLLSDLDYVNNLLKIDIDFETIQSLLIGNSTSFDIDDDEKLRTAIDKNRYFLSSMKKRQLRRGLPEKRLDKLERKQEKNPERERYFKKQERKEEKYDEQVYSIWIDVKTSKILKAMIKDFLNEKELIADYQDFRDDEGQLFPYSAEFRLHAQDTSVIRINYSKITRDKPVDFIFNIPDKYEQMAD